MWPKKHRLQNGKYEIREVLGRGGFGITYKALHRELDAAVVIKTPDILQKKDTEYDRYVRRFKEEGLKLFIYYDHLLMLVDYLMRSTNQPQEK